SCSKEPAMRPGKSKSNNGSGTQPDYRVPNSQVKKELGVSYQTLRRWEARTRKHIKEFGHPLEGDYPLPIWDHGRKYQLRSLVDGSVKGAKRPALYGGIPAIIFKSHWRVYRGAGL